MKFEVLTEDKFLKEYKVTIESSVIQDKVDAVVLDRAKTFKIHGFRAGKAPLDIVKKYTEQDILGKVLDRLIDQACDDLIKENSGIKLSQQPRYEVIEPYSPGKNFEFKCSLFLSPDFDLKEIDFKIDYIEPVISDEDIDDWISNFRKREPIWTESSDPVKSGDLVVYKAPCFVGGKKDDGRSIKESRIVIPENIQDDAELINGFLGKKAKDSFDFVPATDKNCNYKVVVKKVYCRKDISDSEYAKEVGIGSLDKVKELARLMIKDKIDGDAFVYYKHQVLDVLDKEYSFDVPDNIVNEELTSIVRNIISDKNIYGEDSDKTEEELREEYLDIARQRVKLGYVLNSIACANNIVVTDQEMYNSIINESLKYPEHSRKEVMQYYLKNRQAYLYKQASVLEEKVIRFIVDKSDKNTKQMNCKEVEDVVSKIMDDE